MKGLHVVAFSLMALGAVNLGLNGLFHYNLIESVLAGVGASSLVTLLYTLVGLSAVVEVATHAKNCRLCGKK